MRRVFAFVCLAAPFVIASIPAVGARHDIRMMCMAVAATLVARLVWAAVSARRRPAAVAMTFMASTASGSTVAIMFGARAVPGVVAVALVIGGFATAGAALGRWHQSRQRPDMN